MKPLLWLGLLIPAAAFAAAPDSIAGKVYRESFAVASTRTARERTIVFHPDGRYTFLKLATVNLAVPTLGGRVVLEAPPADGTYTYEKTGTASAVLELRDPEGGVTTWPLYFVTSSGGTFVPSGLTILPDLTFRLTDLAETRFAPASNVSMRGRVAPDRPLVVGLAVPGTRGAASNHRVLRPDATARDVLIRVVGPSLASFGVTEPWADPRFELFEGSAPADVLQFQHDDWSAVPDAEGSVSRPDTAAGFRKIFDHVGAFPLHADSKDAAAVVRLAPGAYTIVASPRAGDAGGDVLIEVYFLP